MGELLSSAQMRAIEAAAIASGAVTGLELMERAGKGVVEAIFEEWPELARAAEGRTGALPAAGRSWTGGDPPTAPGYLGQDEGRKAVVLCGPGNNGGDGFVVARLLKELGWEVVVFLYGDPDRLPPDARVNYERWLGMGEVRALTPDALSVGPAPVLCIDALFGIGLSRPVAPELTSALGAFSEAFLGEAKLVALDVFSGLCADSGRMLGEALTFGADLTVTFHCPKHGHFCGDAAVLCGTLRVVDIGLNATSASVRLTTAPREIMKAQGHKYSYGHAFVLSGPSGRGGAARLAARGALRIGAGVVTVGCPPDAMAENAARLDAIMLGEVADVGAFAAGLEDQRINALCLGPGMGTGAREVAVVAAALQCNRPMVMDADALTILAREPGVFAALHDRCVLTPHGGEFARLFPDIAEKLAAPATAGPAYSKVEACREAAKRAGCVVLFKGPDTVIAGPDGRCAINSAQYDRAAPWLATAGSGDVLAGFVTGLLARGFDPFHAACTGAWLHVDCALEFGPGLIAEDLPEQLPAVFRRLLK